MDGNAGAWNIVGTYAASGEGDDARASQKVVITMLSTEGNFPLDVPLLFQLGGADVSDFAGNDFDQDPTSGGAQSYEQTFTVVDTLPSLTAPPESPPERLSELSPETTP